MKISVDIDCSPEEARRLMGLPDMAPIHDAFLGRMKEMMGGGGMSPDTLEQMVRSWAPMGEAGMAAWRQLIGQIARPGKE